MKYAKRRMNDSTAPPLGELWLGGGPPYRPAAPPGEHAVQPRAPAGGVNAVADVEGAVVVLWRGARQAPPHEGRVFITPRAPVCNSVHIGIRYE
jgi:hypothetical protein